MDSNIFYIDENCFLDPDRKSDLESLLKKMLSIFRYMFDEGKDVVITTPYWEFAVSVSGTLIYQVVFEDFPCGLSREERVELMQFLDRCQLHDQPKALSVISIGNDRHDSFSGIFPLAHSHGVDSNTYPIFLFRLCHSTNSSAIFETNNTRKDCFLLADINSIGLYYRIGLKALEPKGKEFLKWARRSFNEIEFHPSLDINNLGIDLNLHIKTIISHLEFLNDNYKKIAMDLNWDIPKIKQSAQALGVDFSDESRNTKKDKQKMALRNVTFKISGKEKIFCCSLHTKILPTAGRIHFYNPSLETGEKILIGIMHKHLLT